MGKLRVFDGVTDTYCAYCILMSFKIENNSSIFSVFDYLKAL